MQSGAGFVTPEVIVLITAALACALDTPAEALRIRSVQPATATVGAPGGMWAKAGILEQHMVRRMGPR